MGFGNDILWGKMGRKKGERNYEKEQESGVEWKKDQKKHETVTNSVSMLDFYLQLKLLLSD